MSIDWESVQQILTLLVVFVAPALINWLRKSKEEGQEQEPQAAVGAGDELQDLARRRTEQRRQQSQKVQQSMDAERRKQKERQSSQGRLYASSASRPLVPDPRKSKGYKSEDPSTLHEKREAKGLGQLDAPQEYKHWQERVEKVSGYNQSMPQKRAASREAAGLRSGSLAGRQTLSASTVVPLKGKSRGGSVSKSRLREYWRWKEILDAPRAERPF